jgi:hypothetical protein
MLYIFLKQLVMVMSQFNGAVVLGPVGSTPGSKQGHK